MKTVPAAVARGDLRLFLGLAVVVALPLVGFVGCDRGRRSDGPVVGQSVVLISIDTLRADHLGVYGASPKVSPRLDRFAEEGIVFLDASSHAPSTLPAHASLMTSMLPCRHGASIAKRLPLGDSALTLAERLATEGFSTAAFTGGGQLDRVWGLDQGFDSYQSTPGADLRSIVARGLEWLAPRSGDRTFLFLHSYETHHPYTPSEERLARFSGDYSGPLPRAIGVELLERINRGEMEISTEDLEFVRAAYSAEIHSADEALGLLFRGLRELGLYDEATIVVTSDHGEEFGEHGHVGWHSHSLYEELLRVPLILRLPGGRRAGTRSGLPARGIDVAPTILDSLGVSVPPSFGGRSLLEPPSDGPSKRPIVAAMDRLGTGCAPETTSLRVGRWKLYGDRLFDLATDPGETKDLATARPALVDRMRRMLERQKEHRSSQGDAGPVRIPSELRDELRALGYLR